MKVNIKLISQTFLFAAMTLSVNIAFAFDVSKIPFKSQEIKAKILQEFKQAQELGRERTFILAVGREGGWAVMWPRSDWASPEEWSRMVREKCEHFTEAACNVVYRNSDWVDFEENKRVLEYVTTFDASKIPFVLNSDRAKLESKYSSRSKNKALAISRHGRYWYVYSKKSPEDAADVALDKCRGEKNFPCFVYAINDEVVFDSNTVIYSK